MILILDNYDSFVFNIARYVEELGHEAHVVRSDFIAVDEIASAASGVIVSPGPCTPNEAGIATEAIRHLSGTLPILGVCLGHQCVAQAFGGEIISAQTPMHGRSSLIRHDGGGLFAGLPETFRVGRYHSLAVDLAEESGVQPCAWTEDGEIMAIRHRQHPTFGVQFHPESVLTEHGYDLLDAFLDWTAA